MKISVRRQKKGRRVDQRAVFISYKVPCMLSALCRLSFDRPRSLHFGCYPVGLIHISYNYRTFASSSSQLTEDLLKCLNSWVTTAELLLNFCFANRVCGSHQQKGRENDYKVFVVLADRSW